MYGVADDADESYGRGGGASAAARVIAKIKEFDDGRITAANAYERVPTRAELDKYDARTPRASLDDTDETISKKLISAGREKDLFRRCTEEYFSLADVAGYGYLYPRYSADKAIAGRVIAGFATRPEKHYEALAEADDCDNVIGDFLYAAFDFNDASGAIAGAGVFDITGRKKDVSVYNEIILGKKNRSYILVQIPEVAGAPGADEFRAENWCRLWNWPRHIGKSVNVRVVTGGDIVALFLDGKPVGRKLAGKANKYYAEFTTGFFQGKLEAVSYQRGMEHSRATLETVTSPRMLKIECKNKSVAVGELAFIDIIVADKDGRPVPYASRDIEISLTDGAVLEVFGNADPKRRGDALSNVCPAYNGAATAAVRGLKPGKVIIKFASDGLLANKMTLKVK
jgi:beta-galactosidase